MALRLNDWLGGAALHERCDCPTFRLELRFELAIVGEVQMEVHGSCRALEEDAQGFRLSGLTTKLRKGAREAHEPEDAGGHERVPSGPAKYGTAKPFEVLLVEVARVQLVASHGRKVQQLDKGDTVCVLGLEADLCERAVIAAPVTRVRWEKERMMYA